MLKIKRIAALVLTFVMLATTFGSLVLAEGPALTEASVTWTKEGPVAKGMVTRIGSKNNWSYSYVERDGKVGLSTTDGYNKSVDSAIFVDLSNDFVYGVEGYQFYEVEVEYFDEGYGRFRLKYDGLPELFEKADDPNLAREGEIVYLNNSKKWKTHTYLVQNPRFKNGWKGHDFGIHLWEAEMGSSAINVDTAIKSQNVIFGNIKVRPVEKYALVQGKMSTTEIGNNFFSTGKVKIDTKIKNFSHVEKDLTVDFIAIDRDGDVGYETSFDVTVPADGTLDKVLEFVPAKKQVYKATMTISGDGTYSTNEIEFAYVHEASRKNPRFAVNNHYLRLMDRDPDYIFPVMARTGIYAVRAGYERNDTYTHEYGGTIGLTPRAVRSLDLHQQYDIKWMPITSYELYDNPNAGVDRYDTTYWNRYVGYTDDMSKKYANLIDWWEIMNECNLKQYPAEWYAEIATELYEVIKKNDPTATVVTGVTSYVDLNWLRTYFENLEYQAFDAISVHPYTFTTAPDEVFTDGCTYTTKIQTLRDMMAEYGYQNVPLEITEVGWDTANHTREEQAAYLAQLYAIYTIPEFKIERTWQYDFLSDGADPNQLEQQLGLIQTWKDVSTPYLAKPGLLSVSWTNEVMTNATFKSNLDTKDIHVFHYDSDTEGQDIIMAWAKPGPNSEHRILKGTSVGPDYTFTNFILKNCTDAKVYDMYGNELDIFQEGTSYSTELSYKPIYIIGNFDEYEIGKSKIDINRTYFDLRDGDIADLVITKNINENISYTFTIDEDAEVEILSDSGFVGDKATIKIGTDKFTNPAEGRLIITGEKSGKLMDVIVKMEPAEAATISLRTEIKGSNLARWTGVLSVRNNKTGLDISGKATFLAPDEYAQKIRPIEIPAIKPGETMELEFNIPEADYGFAIEATVKIELNDGSVYTITTPIDASVATYAHNKPTIDGKVEPGEWSDDMHLKLLEKNQMRIGDSYPEYSGLDDKWSDIVLEWDEDYFYMLLYDYDDVYEQNEVDSNIWQGDSFQLGLSYGAIIDPTYKEHTQVGGAYTPVGPLFVQWRSEGNCGPKEEEVLFAATKEVGCTIYEVRIPWQGYINQNAEIKEGNYFRFNVIVNDADGNGRVGWTQYSAGIGFTADATLFGRIKLIDTKKD